MRKNVNKHSRDKRFFNAKGPAVLFLLLWLASAGAQRQKIYTNGIWLCHWGNIRLNDRWSIATEAEIHLKQWVQRWNEQTFELGLLNRLNAKWRVGAGIGLYRSGQYFDQFFFKTEWRGWQEANRFTGSKWVLRQRLRLEERWIQGIKDGRKTDRYDYVTRVRYRTELLKPLLQGKITPVLANEFMASPGYWNSDRFLDQNRSWLGAYFRLLPSLSVQTLYVKAFQWRANNALEDQNIFRVNVVQQFNLKHNHARS